MLHKSENVNDDAIAYLSLVPLTYTTDFETIGFNPVGGHGVLKKYHAESEMEANGRIILNVNETG